MLKMMDLIQVWRVVERVGKVMPNYRVQTPLHKSRLNHEPNGKKMVYFGVFLRNEML